MQVTFEFIELVLWIITLTVIVIVDIYCFHVWRKDENTFFLALFCLFSLLILAFSCSLVNTYYFGFNYTSMTSSYLLFNPIWLFFRTLFIILTMSGLIIFHYKLNKDVLDTKGVFIPLQVIIMIIVLINYFIPLELIWILFLGAFTFLSIPAIYFYLTIKSTGDLRINSFLIGFGTFGLVAGIMIALPEAWVFLYTFFINLIPNFLPMASFGIRILAPIFITTGIILCIIGEERSRE